jgi:hypothetical protein
VEALLIEPSKPVADLARAVLTAERYYPRIARTIPESRDGTGRIANELADIFFASFVSLITTGISLQEAHESARRAESSYLCPGTTPP